MHLMYILLKYVIFLCQDIFQTETSIQIKIQIKKTEMSLKIYLEKIIEERYKINLIKYLLFYFILVIIIQYVRTAIIIK